MADDYGCRVYWQDLRGWLPFGEVPKPGMQMKPFATRAEAEEFRRTLPVSPDVVVTITASPAPRARRRTPPTGLEGRGGGRNHPTRRMTE